MAGVSSTSPLLSTVPSIAGGGAVAGVSDTGESDGFEGAVLHVAPSHESIKSHLFQGWTLARLNGKPPVTKVTVKFEFKRTPRTLNQKAIYDAQVAKETKTQVTFWAGILANRVSASTHGAILDQSTFLISEPLMTIMLSGEGSKTSEAKAQEGLVLNALSGKEGMEVTAISSEELHLERRKIKLQFTAGIQPTPIPVNIPPTAEEIAESHQKLISLLRAKSTEQKAQRYDAICGLTRARKKSGSFPPISNANLLGKWDLAVLNGIKPKDAVSYQWKGEEEGLLVLECVIAKGKVRITASGDISTSEKGSSFTTSTDSYYESRQYHRYHSSESGWYQINHFLFNPPVAPGKYEDHREWRVVSFSVNHLLFSDYWTNSMLLTRSKEEGEATGGNVLSRFNSIRKSLHKKPFF